MQFNIKDPKDREKLLLEIMYYIMDMKYADRKKFVYIPEEYVTDGGYPLGRIWAELKEAYDQNMLLEEDIRFLLRLKMQLTDSPQKKLEIWLDRANEVEAYFTEHGSLFMPSTTLFHDGANMFSGYISRKSCRRMECYLRIR